MANFSDAMAEEIQALDTGPVKYWRSREQLLDAAKGYMLDRFGTPGMLDANERDRWYERLGMLVDFVDSKLTSNAE